MKYRVRENRTLYREDRSLWAASGEEVEISDEDWPKVGRQARVLVRVPESGSKSMAAPVDRMVGKKTKKKVSKKVLRSAPAVDECDSPPADASDEDIAL